MKLVSIYNFIGITAYLVTHRIVFMFRLDSSCGRHNKVNNLQILYTHNTSTHDSLDILMSEYLFLLDFWHQKHMQETYMQ